MEVTEKSPTQKTLNSNGAKIIDVINPITLEKLYHIEETNQESVDQAYRNAHEVQKMIASLSVAERVMEMLKLRDYIIENREMLITKVIQDT